MSNAAETVARTPEASKRRALGRGLESLLPSRPAPSAPAESGTAEAGTPREIPLDQIERNPFQPRSRFDDDKIAELATSIKATGVVQPVLVRSIADGRFQLIAGERRCVASRAAGKETIPAIVRHVSDEQAMEITIVENLQRADLNPIEQARAYERLARDFKMTQEQMAMRTGGSRAGIANFLRLLRLPQDVQNLVEKGDLSFGHARALLALESPELIRRAAERVVASGMSVRQIETYVQSFLHPAVKEDKAKPQNADPNIREAQDRLQRALGLKVRIEDKNGRGRVVIEYAGLEDFDLLLAALAAGEK